MVALDEHSFIQVEAMRVEPLHPRIQMKLFAALGARVLDKPVEQLTAVALRPVGASGDEVVHVKELTLGQALGDSEPGDSPHLAVGQKRQLITAALRLSFYPKQKIFRPHVGAQLSHDGVTASDFVILSGQCDLPAQLPASV